MSNEVLPNPYDFGSPIQEKGKFADRKEEKEKIREYLQLSDTDDPSYYHLALTGSRASGKTSLVNHTKQVAEDLGFLAAKIDLNEDLVKDDVRFFTEMIDSIVTAGTENGMYGGRSGEIYQKFRDLVDAVNFEMRYELPLGFGSAYVGAQQNGSVNSITQRVLKEDLIELHEEADDSGLSTIVLLIDECDLLAENTALLQKIRNVFSNLEGYVLVLSGTDDMFPDLSDTFSPLPRSFVNVQVDDFDDIEETEECIKKPLSDDERGLIDDKTISDIHRITGGSPYEINLVCHHMYRRYDEQQDSIELSKTVLDDVLHELEGLRQEGHHEIADTIGDLSRSQLQLLTSTLEFPEAPQEFLKKYSLLDFVDELGRRSPSHIEEEVSTTLEELIDIGVVSQESDQISFAGSQFDSLYLRYYVASMDNPGKQVSFFQGESEQYISNIYTKIVEHILDASREKTWGYANEPARPVIEVEESKQDRGQNLYLNLSSGTSLKTGQSTIHSFLTERSSPIASDSEETLTFRCEVEWLSGGFTVIMNGGERIRENIGELANELESCGYTISFETDFYYLSKGNSEKDEGNFDEAIDLYQQAKEINPHNRVPDLLQAECEHERGNSDHALEILTDICRDEPDWIYPFITKGLIRLGMDDGNDGFGQIKKALPDMHREREAWIKAIKGLSSLGEVEKSNELADKLSRIKSQHPYQNQEIFRTLFESEKYNRAINRFEEIDLSKYPPSIKAYLRYAAAKSFSMIDEVENAVDALETAIELESEYREKALEDDEFDDIRNDDRFQEVIESTT